MKHFSIELSAQSPLAIRADHAPGGAATAKLITGTTLAGSLAAAHRLLYSERTEEFEALFLGGQVSYPNLYPATFKNPKMQDAPFPVYPAPKTAQTCKRFSGFRYKFKGEEDEEDRHGVRDSLLDWAMFELGIGLGSRKGDPTALAALQAHKSCGTCRAAMDHFNGYYRRDEHDPGRPMISAKINTRLQTHTGIDRELGIVEEGILYNRQVFDEGMHFWGMVKLPDALVSPFKAFIGEVAKSGLVRVGTGRTRGLGKVALSLTAMEEEQDKFNSFKARLRIFDTTLKKQAKEYGINNLDPFYFALTLYSPVILYDESMRYHGSIDGETLANLASLSPSPFKLEYQAASVRRVTGWNELWGTPRTNEYPIEAGSVFLFASTIEPGDTLLRALFDLEEQGIGRRRAEGFGRVCLSDPFHLEGELR